MGKQAKKKTKLERKAELREQYDVYVSAYGGYAVPNNRKPLIDLIERVAKEVDLKPSFLYTIAIGEGLGELYLDEDKNPLNYKNGKLLTDKRISGFAELGLDFFSSPKEYPRFKKYLPSDYNIHDEYEPYMAKRNERNGVEIVPSATFKDLESAIEGFGAVLAHRRDLFLYYSKQYGYKTPSDDEYAYWVYCFYQAEADAKSKLKKVGSLAIFNSKVTSRLSIHIKALERVANWRYILHYNLFSE